MVTLISKSPDETFAIGEQWGRQAQRGSVIGLSGDMGAGKTQLVKGIASGLGSPARVHSPTFALLNEYAGGRLPLFHIDLYRLNSPDEVEGAGLEEYLANPSGVTVVEWIERWLPDLRRADGHFSQRARGITRIAIIDSLGETERRITYDSPGP
jgi:tRNA threonylcarbamoyladenosine biosynthesis protein TsaE